METKMSLLFLYLLVTHMGCVFAATTTQNLAGILRDQAPDTMKTCTPNGSCGEANGGNGFAGTDFQLPLGYYRDNEKGLVGPECNAGNSYRNCGRINQNPLDRTPVYAYTGMSPWKNIQSPESFRDWFHNTPRVRFVNHSVPLAQQPNNLYYYRNNSFFPLDGRGWKDTCNGHNYGYCFEAHTRFKYQGGEVFKFTGDDDVWVYINDMLVIDLGSLHTALSQTVNLNDIAGLVRNTIYKFDFFYCERHTTESNMEITTSLGFICGFDDWCGMCEGNGQSCCSQAIIDQYCNDDDPCTTDTCGVMVPPAEGGCVHTRINCTAPDACNTATCSKATAGRCVIEPINCNVTDKCVITSCDPRSGCQRRPVVCPYIDECTLNTCDPARGCVSSPKTCFPEADKCTNVTCDARLGCQSKPIICNPTDKCLNQACNPASGCSSAAVPCSDGKACTDDRCSAASGCYFPNTTCTGANKCLNYFCQEPGGCTTSPKNCSDGNPCTEDLCSPTTGCSNPPKVCPAAPNCFVAQCIRAQGGCVNVPLPCEDNNACTNNTCNPATGTCAFPPIDCNDNNVCTNDTCVNGVCVRTPISCSDGDRCTQDVCDRVTGCSNPPLTCNGVCTDQSCLGCPNVQNACDDGNACTINACSPSGNCTKTDVVCPDGTRCQVKSCDPKTGCKLTDKPCDDFNPCTTDSCSLTTGACVNDPVPNCVSCAGVACTYTDSCLPQVCNETTRQCQVAPVVCNDGNACTTDTCDGTGRVHVCRTANITCNAPTDLCNPWECFSDRGCVKVPKPCNDGDLCTSDYCDVADGTCKTSPVLCEQTDLCSPATCNSTTGNCTQHPIVCTAGNLCSSSVCEAGRCVETRNPCGDICNPAICDDLTGVCANVTTPPCTDGNPCTIDIKTCTADELLCSFPPNETMCQDNNMCTIDSCNSTAVDGQDPCVNTPVVCEEPTLCERFVGCLPDRGCVYEPLDCNANNTDWCMNYTCEPLVGCFPLPRVCPNRDIGCFNVECVNGTGKPSTNGTAVLNGTATSNSTLFGSCVESRKSNFDGSTSITNGQLCFFVYDKKKRDAVITGGVLAGVIIGAVAAAALIGFGGKAGYDYLMAKNSPIGDVGNNPLYAPSGGSGENALYA